MVMATTGLTSPGEIGAGEVKGPGTNLASTVFEDGLLVGRFAKLDTGSIDNLDNSVTPILAGVVRRNITNAIESGGTIDSSIHKQVSYRRRGLIAVDVLAGQVPVQFTRVYANNDATANAGLAMAAAGGNNVTTTAEYIEEIDTDVWLIELGAYDPS